MVAGEIRVPGWEPGEIIDPVEFADLLVGSNDAVADWLNPVLTREEVDDVSD
ncbi:MAG: hypothetical protein ABI146_07455 [Nitrobacter sp.]